MIAVVNPTPTEHTVFRRANEMRLGFQQGCTPVGERREIARRCSARGVVDDHELDPDFARGVIQSKSSRSSEFGHRSAAIPGLGGQPCGE